MEASSPALPRGPGMVVRAVIHGSGTASAVAPTTTPTPPACPPPNVNTPASDRHGARAVTRGRFAIRRRGTRRARPRRRRDDGRAALETQTPMNCATPRKQSAGLRPRAALQDDGRQPRVESGQQVHPGVRRPRTVRPRYVTPPVRRPSRQQPDLQPFLVRPDVLPLQHDRTGLLRSARMGTAARNPLHPLYHPKPPARPPIAPIAANRGVGVDP